MPTCCSALAAASITTPFPVPAGPTRIAPRSGPVMTSSAWCLLGAEASADPLGDRSLAFARATAPTSRSAAWASVVNLRSIACSRARTLSVVIRPPSSGRTRRSAIIARENASASPR